MHTSLAPLSTDTPHSICYKLHKKWTQAQRLPCSVLLGQFLLQSDGAELQFPLLEEKSQKASPVSCICFTTSLSPDWELMHSKYFNGKTGENSLAVHLKCITGHHCHWKKEGKKEQWCTRDTSLLMFSVTVTDLSRGLKCLHSQGFFFTFWAHTFRSLGIPSKLLQ